MLQKELTNDVSLKKDQDYVHARIQGHTMGFVDNVNLKLALMYAIL